MLRTLNVMSRPMGARAFSAAGSEKIAMVGSGNFGSALVRILGRNATKHDVFDNEVKMYVHEEMIEGKKLTEIINETNENVKYLKGAKFTPNVVACPDIADAVKGATMICFCLPHQFLKPMVPAIKAAAAPGVKCLSAIKGIDFDDQGIVLISDIIRKELNADCSVLMGANVANDMASDAFCETTIGYKDPKNGELFKLAYDDPALKVGTVQDTVGVELCGALKNIVAIGAGYVDGLGMGGNTKAAIIRIGLKEMVKFCKMFYPNDGISDDTFLESCGVADLITTCFGGRNRKCAEAFAKHGKSKSLEEIEAELLGGQKLQGTLTAKEVNHILKMKGLEHEFPFSPLSTRSHTRTHPFRRSLILLTKSESGLGIFHTRDPIAVRVMVLFMLRKYAVPQSHMLLSSVRSSKHSLLTFDESSSAECS